MTRYRAGGIVVDVGCGQGGQLSALREAGCRPIGLELAEEAARACHAKRHPVIIAAAESLPFRDESCHGSRCPEIAAASQHQNSMLLDTGGTKGMSNQVDVGECSMIDTLVAALEQDGVVRLPMLLSAEQLAAMQQAFSARLRQLRWNNINGYEKTEPYRHMVEDVLTLEQGFVDLAVHPIVKQVLRRYLGQYALVEARGWRSMPTKRDFHGWHGDEWYDQQVVTTEIPKEVKLGFYLSDVRSGAFNYIMRTHRKEAPRRIRTADLPAAPASRIEVLTGPAGTAFLFDTSGIHRQGVPMLEPRQVIFLNYHDPAVPLQQADRESYRYHPLLLNAAFLGNLSDEDRRILGFGDKTSYRPAFGHSVRYEGMHRAVSRIHDFNLRLQDLRIRFVARVNRRSTRVRP